MKYKIKISRFQLIVLILIVFLIIYLAYKSGPNPNYEFKSTDIAPKEYWNLFSEAARKKMGVIQTVTLKFQHPITDFAFSKNQYFIKVFKFNTTFEKPINEFIAFSKAGNFLINGVPYLNMGGLLFNVNFKTGKNETQRLTLNLRGSDNDFQIKNDSIAYLYSNFKLLSINYNDSDTTAIWAMSAGKPPEIPTLSLPIELLFIRRQQSIYMLIMSVNDARTSLPENKLYNLVFDK